MALISFVSFNHCSPVSLFMYSISIPIMIWVLSSAAEPLAISKNLAFSFSVDRSMPSAMFDGIERLERMIWSLNPKSLGSPLICIYQLKVLWNVSRLLGFRRALLFKYLINSRRCSVCFFRERAQA